MSSSWRCKLGFRALRCARVGFAVVQRAAVCRRVRAADLGNVCAAKQRWTGRMQTYSAATVAEQIRNALRGKKKHH